MEVLLDICRVVAALGCLAWLISLVRGRESLKDARGRLRPLPAALVAVAFLSALGWIAAVTFET